MGLKEPMILRLEVWQISAKLPGKGPQSKSHHHSDFICKSFFVFLNKRFHYHIDKTQTKARREIPMTTTGTQHEEATVSCGTTKGPITIQLYRDWSPLGYDRAVELFERGFYDYSHFFRVLPRFIVQFGISYTLEEPLKALAEESIPDDPPLSPPVPFERGTVAFAGTYSVLYMVLELHNVGMDYARTAWDV
jgi:hypothetical protein